MAPLKRFSDEMNDPGYNLYAALRSGFDADLDRCAIETDSGLSYCWRDLERGSAMLANLLMSLELPARAEGAPAPPTPPIVAVQAEKSVESLLLYLACLRAGFVYLPLNTAYQAAELAYFIGDAEPAVVVCSARNFSWFAKLAFQQGVHHVFTLGDDRSGSLLARAAYFSDRHAVVPRAADDLAAILYTSGTTGRSKGAMLSHANLLSNARTLHGYWDWRADDVLIHALPIFHVHGLFVAIHGALLAGARILWLSRFEPRAVIERLARATVFMGVPTLYVRLLQESALTREGCVGMRLFISGSAPLLVETFREWQTRTGHVILERYGMSETVMLSSNPCRPEDGDRKGGTVGPALPGVKIRIAGDRCEPLTAGATGQVQVHGPNVFAGYWRMPEKTAEEFVQDADGWRWFRTGDLGRFDQQGYLSIVGRSKDLVISGGYNVYPAEVESCLNESPAVAESAVIGVPHPDLGEAVVAVVVAAVNKAPAAGFPLHVQEPALLAWLKARIAGYKVPKRVVVMAELPRNAMGKVQKNVLREQYRALFIP